MHHFQIQIGPAAGGVWPITANTVGAETASAVVTGALRLDMEQLRPAEGSPAYGQALGGALLADPALLGAFRAALAAGPRLCLTLQIDDPDLRELRWEQLAVPVDQAGWTSVALDQRFCFAFRVLSSVERPLSQIPPAAARALIVVASPPGLERYQLAHFDVPAVARELRRAIGYHRSDLLAAGAGAVGRPRLSQICARLSDRPAHVLHIVCHGRLGTDGKPALFLEGEDGQATPVAVGEFARQLALSGDAQQRPQLIYLMSCATADPTAEAALGGAAHYLVRELGTPSVVAMTDRVSQATARQLSERFYRRLRHHGAPDRALVEARAGLLERPDVAVAALYSRLDGRPLFPPGPARWPWLLAAAAAALLILLLAGWVMLDPILAQVGASRARGAGPPPPQLPGPALIAVPAAPPGCISLTLAEAELLPLPGEAEALFDAAKGRALAAVSWSCDGDGDARAEVALFGPPAYRVSLLHEPARLTYGGPPGTVAAFARAAALYALGRYEGAANLLDGLADDGPDAGDLRWLRGNTLLRLERWPEAAAVFEAGFDDADRGRAARLRANFALALILAQRSQPGSPAAARCAAPLLDGLAAEEPPLALAAELALVRAALRFYCTPDEVAPKAWDELAAAMPGLADGRLRADALTLRAQMRLARPADEQLGGRFEVHADACAALALDPDLAEPHAVLGYLAARLWQDDAARARFERYARAAFFLWQRQEGFTDALRLVRWPSSRRGQPFSDPAVAACPEPASRAPGQ